MTHAWFLLGGEDGVRLALAALVLFNAVVVMILANPVNQRYGKPLPVMLAFGTVMLAEWLVKS